MNLLYACNDAFFKGIVLSTLSIAKHTSSVLNIYVLTIDLHDVNPKYIPVKEEKSIALEQELKKYNPDSTVTVIDVREQYIELFKGSNVEKNKYSPYAFLRLLSCDVDILPDKVLYIDSDILALKDIKELYDIDITNYDYAMCKDQVGKWFLNYNMCNSGVVLINMKRVKENKIFKLCQNYILTHHSQMPDQDALNICSDSLLIIDQKYNEQIKIKPDTVLFHFNQKSYFFPYIHFKNIKQWEIDRVHKEYKIFDFDDLYEIYLPLKDKFE